MATITAQLTVNSDITDYGLGINKTMTMTKAGTNNGLDRTTGVQRVYLTDTKHIDLAKGGLANTNLADMTVTGNTAGKIYIKNTTDTDVTSYLLVEVGSNVIVGRLYPGDWLFIPYDGTEDIKVSTSAANMYYEYAIFHEG